MEERDLLEVRFPDGRTCLCADAVLLLDDGTRVPTDLVVAIEITDGALFLARPDRVTAIPLGRFRQITFEGLSYVPGGSGGVRVSSARLLRERSPGGPDA